MIDIISSCLSWGNCTLSMTDSTTAEGWMWKSNFSKEGNNLIQASTCVDAARKYMEIFLNTDIKGYIQWFMGKSNSMSQMLSLTSGILALTNSPFYFITISQTRCQTISQYYCSPARLALGWHHCCGNCPWESRSSNGRYTWWHDGIAWSWRLLFGQTHQTWENHHAWSICYGCQRRKILMHAGMPWGIGWGHRAHPKHHFTCGSDLQSNGKAEPHKRWWPWT